MNGLLNSYKWIWLKWSETRTEWEADGRRGDALVLGRRTSGRWVGNNKEELCGDTALKARPTNTQTKVARCTHTKPSLHATPPPPNAYPGNPFPSSSLSIKSMNTEGHLRRQVRISLISPHNPAAQPSRYHTQLQLSLVSPSSFTVWLISINPNEKHVLHLRKCRDGGCVDCSLTWIYSARQWWLTEWKQFRKRSSDYDQEHRWPT